MSVVVKLEDVHKSFGLVEVLRGISFEVSAGEVVAIIGRSGSGKSTALRCINRLEKIQSGSIEVCGRRVDAPDLDLRALRQDVGIVFQSYNLFPHLTVEQNIVLAPRRVKHVKGAQAHELARAALEQVGLSDKIDAYPEQLSGGQQQRVAIARALVTHPKLILADEPTGNLDTHHGEEVMRMIQALNAEGSTIVMVTHSPAHADYATRVVNMLDGRILQERRRAA